MKKFKHKICCFCKGDLEGNNYVCPKCWGNDKKEIKKR